MENPDLEVAASSDCLQQLCVSLRWQSAAGSALVTCVRWQGAVQESVPPGTWIAVCDGSVECGAVRGSRTAFYSGWNPEKYLTLDTRYVWYVMCCYASGGHVFSMYSTYLVCLLVRWCCTLPCSKTLRRLSDSLLCVPHIRTTTAVGRW